MILPKKKQHQSIKTSAAAKEEMVYRDREKRDNLPEAVHRQREREQLVS